MSWKDILVFADGSANGLARACMAATSAQAQGARLITTTDIHLPRVIGNALERAFKQRAEFTYAPEEHFVRVKWAWVCTRGDVAEERI